jgi:Domain of unknown function (DUF222)/HNH endonuclease
MDSNTHSTQHPSRPSAGPPDGLTALAAVVDQLAAEDLTGLPKAERAQRILGWRQLLDRQEGLWLKELAGVDATGAAGAEQGVQAGSTAGWLRRRLRMSAGAAHRAVRTARALFRGPLPQTGQALTDGELSPAHAAVLAAGTQDLPAPVTSEAEPVLVEAARRLDPGRLRRVVGHLQLVADPEEAASQAERRHGRRGLWLAATLDGMVAVDGLLEAEAGQTLLAALEPLARPHSAEDTRSGGQRRADALTELARRALEGGRLPQTGGVRPQLTVIVDLDSLTSHPGAGAVGGAIDSGVLDPEACRRLACDAAVTRVLVTRQPTPDICRHLNHPSGGPDEAAEQGLATRLQAAMTLLPPILGGAPSQPLDVGRTSRVVTPAQRSALAVRDGGCAFPDCDRPLAWCEGHHLIHWLDGGPTDLANLALLCRSHHRAVHEGGWQLARGPDGRLTATPPSRPPRRQSAAA